MWRKGVESGGGECRGEERRCVECGVESFEVECEGVEMGCRLWW